MAKSDTVKARFKKAIEQQIDYFEPFRKFGMTASHQLGSIDPESFFSVKPNSSLAKAFAAAGLNSSEPFAWKRLLNMFAGAHFPIETRGRNPKWTSRRYSQLLSDYDQTKAKTKTKANDTKIADKMIRTFGGRYAGMAPSTLRRIFPVARDPRRNLELGELIMEIRDFMESRPECSEMSVAQVKERATAHAIKALSESWKREQKTS